MSVASDEPPHIQPPDNFPITTLIEKLRLSCKGLELILSNVCVGLSSYAPIENHASDQALVMIAFGTYVIIMSGITLGYIMNKRVSRLVDALFTCLGVLLFFSAGVILISHYHDHSTEPPIRTNTAKLTRDEEISQKVADKFIPTSVRMGLSAGSLGIINSLVFLSTPYLLTRKVEIHLSFITELYVTDEMD